MTPIVSLQKFVAAAKRAHVGPRCEVCGGAIATEHRHVVDKQARRLLCACQGCVLAFGGEQPARFRAVPDSSRPAFVGESDLDKLGIPVGLAFFFKPSSLGRWVAIFPSVAGATEAELEREAEAVLDACALLEDVEALLVHRPRGGSSRCFIVPVSTGYELTATFRKTWRGIDGGDEARRAVDALFGRLAAEVGVAA